MQLSSIGSLAPLALLTAAFVNCSLITLPFLLAFILIQYKSLWIGITPKHKTVLLLGLVVYTFLIIIVEGLITILWSIKEVSWRLNSNWFIQLLGFERFDPHLSLPYLILVLCSHILVAVTTICTIKIRPYYANVLDFSWGTIQGRAVLRSIILPGVQLVAAVVRPCWISFPFFICSCVGLFHWSITGNFVGLSWGWDRLLFLAGSEIVFLFLYQMPFVFPEGLQNVADNLGLFQISNQFGWLEFVQAIALLSLFILLSVSIYDIRVAEGYILYYENVLPRSYNNPIWISPQKHDKENFLIERLLGSPEMVSNADFRINCSWTKTLPNSRILQLISVNFFIYGFPAFLFILCLWSFKYASISAFFILIYVGFIFYAFPSVIMLWRLNTALLLFILFWTLLTYIFNAIFTVIDDKLGKDTRIWNSIGFWHYPIPGLFLLAQFVLGILLATSMYLTNVALHNMHPMASSTVATNVFEEEAHDKKFFILAMLAWCIRRTAHSVSLLLLLLAGVRHGVIGAIYILFFLFFLLKPQLAGQMRRCLIIVCELHLGIMYMLQLDIFSVKIVGQFTWLRSIFSILGLLDEISMWDFPVISALVVFSAFQLHGHRLIGSLAIFVEKSQVPPFGFTALKSSLSGPILISIFTSSASDYLFQERKITGKWSMEMLLCFGKELLRFYQFLGNFSAAATVLFVVYKLGVSYVSFGYFTLLVYSLASQQLIGKTQPILWAPLFAYSLIIFLIEYMLTCFPLLQEMMRKSFSSYPDVGFVLGSSFIGHLWHSLVILIVLQLFRDVQNKKFGDWKGEEMGAPISAYNGFMAIVKRFLILHVDKILIVSIFYASISPISFIGFLYLLILVVSAMFPKHSSVPAKVASLFTALVTSAEFLYQLFGKKLQLFPGQSHGSFAYWLGFRVFDGDFWGLECGFRSRILVFCSCFLQFHAFCWLKDLPEYFQNAGRFNEPCSLFLPCQPTVESRPKVKIQPKQSILETEGSEICLDEETNFIDSEISSVPKSDSEIGKRKNVSFSSFPKVKHSRQWSKKAMLAIREERYKAQLRTLGVYSKHLAENFFSMFGVEICMVTLLFASFAVLNIISLVYMVVLSVCILLSRQTLKSFWPYFVMMFASILLVEYILSGKVLPSWNVLQLTGENDAHCQSCWKDFEGNMDYCRKCWLGIIVDDWETLNVYFIVFWMSCLKLKSDMCVRRGTVSASSESIFLDADRMTWKEINYETRGQWTWLDSLRFFFYHRFLDIVLLLVFITGTFQYDVLHLGYLAFALVFFRMRAKLLMKRNEVFRFLRLYNFTLITLSLLYQAPYFDIYTRDENAIFSMIGFVKMPSGFNTTCESILVDISIFCVSLVQSSIFCSKEFNQVLSYLEAEEMDFKLQAHESKAAWKTEQLQRTCILEDMKQKRHLQVEKMKAEMFNVKLDMDPMATAIQGKTALRETHNKLRVLQNVPDNGTDNHTGLKNTGNNLFCEKRNMVNMGSSDLRIGIGVADKKLTRVSADVEASRCPEILEEDSPAAHHVFNNMQRKGLYEVSKQCGTHKIEYGVVSQVQSLGNKALENLTGLLHIDQSENNDAEGSSVERESEQVKDKADEERTANPAMTDKTNFIDEKRATRETAYRLSMLCSYLYSKARSNMDAVCYFLFFAVYEWEFSLLMLLYPASMFFYALLVNPGPSQRFWLSMLVYTEGNILIQYLNQIFIYHTGNTVLSSWGRIWLERLGIPMRLMNGPFVLSVTPLFLVYLSTLVQCSIKAHEGEWMSVFYKRRRQVCSYGPSRVWSLVRISTIKDMVTSILRSFCRFCLALVNGSEEPPHYVQVTMKVNEWPEDGIQPGKIQSEFNKLLKSVHHYFCESQVDDSNHSASTVLIESIENSQQNDDTVVAILEVTYVAPRGKCPASQQWTSLNPSKDVAWEIRKAKDEGLVERTSFPFPIMSVIASGKREVDFYAYIFGCDLVAFFFLAVGYQSFIKNSPEFLNVYQLEDQFPKDFVFALMTLFFLIILDRVIYLWSFAIGKVLYYLCTLGLFGYYVTFYGWKMSSKEHGLLLLRIFCIMKGLSLALQASQIKYGLPQKTALYEQFLTRKVSHLNYIVFRIYRSLPFLFELRCILDWSCSATSLTMYDWLKLEDIYASLYLVKCDGKLSRQKHQLGERRGIWSKFFTGICTFLVLIFIIWAPMLMYSSGNPTNYANPILDVHVRIDVDSGSGKFTLYKTSLCSIFPLEELASLGTDLDPHLQEYESRDVQLICCEADADNLWLVPPPTWRRLVNLIDHEADVIARWEFTRQRPKAKEVALYINQTKGFSRVEDANGTITSFRIPELHPQYFRVTSTGDVRMLEGTVDMVSGNLTLTEGSESWWTFIRDNASIIEGCEKFDGPFVITVSEEIPQGLIGDTLSKFSIASLYITFVLAVGRFIRLQCADLRMRIPYENLPSCDRFIALCEGIYAARAAGELILEEGLFWTLIRIYRSPDALIEYTKLE